MLYGGWPHRKDRKLLHSDMSVEMRHLGPSPLRDLQKQATGNRGWRMFGLSMLDRDPPDHTRLRKLVSKAFTQRSIADLEPLIIAEVDAALNRMESKKRCDLVEELAFSVPFAIIAEMLGMPKENHERLRELNNIFGRALEPVGDPELASAIADAETELIALTAEAIAWKRTHPADDLLTALVNTEENGDSLSEKELIAQVCLLHGSGHQTSANLIANGALALLRAPEQLDLLRRNPDLITNAIEELLRFDSPVQLSRRITTSARTLGGHEIPPGSLVLALIGSANRDEEVWGGEAESLQVDREKLRNHLSFGFGPHRCIGASLARLEGRIAFSRMLRRFESMELDGEPTSNRRINLRGLDKLPIAV